MAQNQDEPTRRASGFVSFVAGFVFTISFGIVVGAVLASIYSLFAIHNPFDLMGLLFAVLFIVIVPIAVGRMWKSKDRTYWTGVFLGLITLFIAAYVLIVSLQIGSSPV